MASDESRKRKRSAASESGPSLVSEDLMLRIDALDMSSQHDATSETLFKKPRRSIRKKDVPTGTIASEKLEYNDESHLPGYRWLDIKMETGMEGFEDKSRIYKQKVYEVSGDYIVDLAAMISSMSEVASCNQCEEKEGVMQLFEIECPGTCASKLLFRCSKCKNAKIFMNVGEVNPSTTNRLDISCVLGARIVGMNSEKLRTFNGCVNLPPAPTPYTFTKIHSEVLTAAEEEAKASMERATMELKSQFPIDPITNCVYVPASIDGTYNSSACFSSIISTKTGKALAYKVASNSCSTCSLYNNKDENATLTERERDNWDAHMGSCRIEYPDIANIHLETAVAPELIKEAYERGIVFHTLVGDGDNDAVESLNITSRIYQKLGIDQNIRKIECLSHVMRTMMSNLIRNQLEAGECLIEEPSVESQPREIKNMTRAIAGRIGHLYRLALQNNDGNPTGAKDEINAIPYHLGANDTNASVNHQFCPGGKDSWCDYNIALLDNSPAPHHPDYLSAALVEHVQLIFSEFHYNDEEFIKTVSFGMTTNHNEAMYRLFSDMVPKKEKAGLDAVKLGAALAIIRYNDGFKAVENIFRSFSPSNPLIRTKEAFRLMDNKRIKTSKNPIPWKDTYAKEQMNEAKLREQKSKYGEGYSHGNYSKSLIVDEDVHVSDVQEDSQDEN